MIKIVLAEDDVQERQLYEKFLLKIFPFVRTVSSGKEAISTILSINADILITDILMPDINGLEVIAYLMGKMPNLKIIAISGGNIATDPNDGLALASKLGAKRILKKPFTRDEFNQTVTSTISAGNCYDLN